MHSPWHLERQRRIPACKLGNCRNTYHLPLWVQSRLNTDSSLPQEQYFLGSGSSCSPVETKGKADSAIHMGTCFAEGAFAFCQPISSHPGRKSSKEAILPPGSSMEGHFLKKNKFIFSFSSLSFQLGHSSFPSPPQHLDGPVPHPVPTSPSQAPQKNGLGYCSASSYREFVLPISLIT